MECYTYWYTPLGGDIVWDVGAHAGVTSCFLSRMVGTDGRVYAWEPDDLNYECLLYNIKEHGLANVVPIKKALDGKTGTAKFQMDGTMSAGLRDYLFYADAKVARTVETLSMADASGEYGAPVYVKMDIEGAELAVIGGALGFLRSQPVHWAIETNHLVENALTYLEIERLFKSIGYRTYSSDQFHLWHTWAAPGKSREIAQR